MQKQQKHYEKWMVFINKQSIIEINNINFEYKQVVFIIENRHIIQIRIRLVHSLSNIITLFVSWATTN